MSVAEALAVALALALVWTLVSGAGWLISRWRPDEDARRYVTIARLEDALTKQQERHDAALLAMDRRLAAAVARQDMLERALDEEQEKRRADHTRLSEMQRRVEAWMSYARQLADIIRRELKTEPPPEPAEPEPPAPPRPTPLPPPPPPPPPPVPAWADTSSRLAACFSVSELNDLAMELALLEAVAGESLEERASSLTLAAVRRGVLSELRTIARRERPRGGF